MLCFDKIAQTNGCQFFTNAGDVDTQGIVVNIKLAVPEKIHNIAAGTDFSCVFKKVVEDFHFIFCEISSEPMVFYEAAFQM